MRRALVAAGFVAALAAGLGIYHVYGPRVTAAPQPPLARLEGSGVAPFAKLFDETPQQTRVVLMLSPT